MNRLFIFFALVGFLAAYVGVGSAHTTGASFEKTVGGHTVDIGYDAESPQVGAPIRFDFSLRNATSSVEVPFSSVWVRVEKDGATFFASGIHRADLGKTGMLYTFGESGAYTLSARFEENAHTLTELSFPITVSDVPQSSWEKFLPYAVPSVLGMIGLFAGTGICRFWSRKADRIELR